MGSLLPDEHTDAQGVGEQDLDPVQLFLDFGEGVLHFQYPRRGIFKGHARTDQGEDALVEGELPHGHVIAEFGHVRDAVLDGFESVGFLAEGFRRNRVRRGYAPLLRLFSSSVHCLRAKCQRLWIGGMGRLRLRTYSSAAWLSAGGIPEAKNTEAMIRTKKLFIGTPVMVQG